MDDERVDGRTSIPPALDRVGRASDDNVNMVLLAVTPYLHSNNPLPSLPSCMALGLEGVGGRR